MEILDGKKVSNDIKEEIEDELINKGYERKADITTEATA